MDKKRYKTCLAHHRNFASEPMKHVTELAGIGEVLGKRLENQGFDKADTVLGKFLVLNRDKEPFQKWMKETGQANSKQSSDCYNCLNEWCEDLLQW